MMLGYNDIRETAIRARSTALQFYVDTNWIRNHGRGRPHALSCGLTVSLTSYPKRFPTLASTLRSLLAQSVQPTRIVLWLSPSDRELLPADVLSLQDYGVLFGRAEDWRSYNKIVPALRAYPEDILVTADDDIFYWRDWLADLLAARRPRQAGQPREVVCARAHWINLQPDGSPKPYTQWDINTAAQGPSPRLFPTGCGGVLYEPGVLHPDVTKSELFMKMCPSTDDLWLYWMAVRNGVTFRKCPRHFRLVTWQGSQTEALYHTNNLPDGGNDVQLRRLLDLYGWPAGQSQMAAVA